MAPATDEPPTAPGGTAPLAAVGAARTAELDDPLPVPPADRPVLELASSVLPLDKVATAAAVVGVAVAAPAVVAVGRAVGVGAFTSRVTCPSTVLKPLRPSDCALPRTT